jgi:hypothetical protein
MTRDFKAGVFAVGLLGVAGVFPVSAQLPSLSDKDVLGYFVAADSKSFQFRIASDGKATIKVLDSKGDPVNNELTIPVIFTVEETLPGGKTISRKIIPESLESAQAATLKPKDITIKGKVTGDIGFEVFVSEDRGAIMLGGHLLNPAELKNPTRFAIEVRIPNSMPKSKADEDDKKAAKELEEKIKDDKVQLVWTDGKKAKIAGDKAVEGSSKEVTGPGVTAASIEFATFKERKILVTAAPNSSMRLTNPATRPLVEGFSLFWSADPAKDAEGKARITIEVK